MDQPGIVIDPALDPAAPAGAFLWFGRMHVPGFLNPAAAEAVAGALDAANHVAPFAGPDRLTVAGRVRAR